MIQLVMANLHSGGVSWPLVIHEVQRTLNFCDPLYEKLFYTGIDVTSTVINDCSRLFVLHNAEDLKSAKITTWIQWTQPKSLQIYTSTVLHLCTTSRRTFPPMLSEGDSNPRAFLVTEKVFFAIDTEDRPAIYRVAEGDGTERGSCPLQAISLDAFMRQRDKL